VDRHALLRHRVTPCDGWSTVALRDGRRAGDRRRQRIAVAAWRGNRPTMRWSGRRRAVAGSASQRRRSAPCCAASRTWRDAFSAG
jgi:hypothetical protein